MDRGAWRATVHGVAESWTRLKRLSMHSLGGIVQVPGGSSLSCVNLGELKTAQEDKEQHRTPRKPSVFCVSWCEKGGCCSELTDEYC